MLAEGFKHVDPPDPKGAETEYAKENPTKRSGVPEEVAKAVAFLLSYDGSYVSGQMTAIDVGPSNSYGNVIEEYVFKVTTNGGALLLLQLIPCNSVNTTIKTIVWQFTQSWKRLLE